MANKKILIVDDEPDMRLAIKNVLKIRGYDSIEAGDGKKAVELVEKENPDLVLLDIRLPGMDGVEALERIRKFNKKVPVVMITGYGHIQSAVDVMKLGAQEYLQKPFENAELIEVVRRFTEEKNIYKDEIKDISKEKEKEFSFSNIIFLFLGALIIIGGFLYKVNKDKENYKKIYPIEFNEVSGIAIDKNNIFIGDWIKQKIAKYEILNGVVNFIEDYNMSGIHLTAIAIAGNKLYISDSWRSVVEERELDNRLNLVRTYNNFGKIMSMSFDGKKLWMIDNEGNLYVKEYSDTNSSLVYKVLKFDEIYSDSKYLWGLIFKEGKIYRYKIDKNMELDKVFRIKNENKEISAFTMSNGKVYYTLIGEPYIVEINKEGLIED